MDQLLYYLTQSENNVSNLRKYTARMRQEYASCLKYDNPSLARELFRKNWIQYSDIRSLDSLLLCMSDDNDPDTLDMARRYREYSDIADLISSEHEMQQYMNVAINEINNDVHFEEE